MYNKYYYDLCWRHMGRPVKITTIDGRIHRGIIQDVDYHKVYLQPHYPHGLGGFGYGFYGPPYGYGYGPGFGYGIALGAIGTLALLPLFW